MQVKKSISTALLSGLVFSVFSTASLGVNAQAFKVCYENEDNYPGHIKDGKGIDIILLEMAAAKSGVKMEMVPLPWKRCIADVEAGTMDGLFTASYKDDRAKFAAYPMAGGKPDAAHRMRYDSYSLYRAKGGTASWDGTKFSNITGAIGVQAGYSIADDLKKKGMQVDEGAKNAEGNMRKLAGGAMQAIALLTLEGDLILSKPEFSGKVEKVSPPLVEKPYFIIFGKVFYGKNQKAVDDFWATLATVRESAEYKAKIATVLKK